MTNTVGPHLLGRIPPPDLRHLEAYTLRVPAPPRGIEVNIARPRLSGYNQGQTPECVAYAASRVMNWFNHFASTRHGCMRAAKKLTASPA
jgi:hypothetical protein